MKKILVIKLGALGDFLQAMGPFKALRDHYGEDHLTLLTTPSYKDLAEKSGYFDEVLAFPRLRGYHFFKIGRRLLHIKKQNFTDIYDLQTSSHTSRYYYYLRLLGWRGKFSGISKGCSHPHKNIFRDFQHTIDRQKEQLKDAGISKVPFPNLSFLLKDPSSKNIAKILDSQKKFVLLLPGAAPTRPQKRWPIEKWKNIIQHLQAQKVTSIIIGSQGEEDLISAFSKQEPFLINLIGKTSLEDLAHLGKHAFFALGNDTGPMHLLSLDGCPCLILFNLQESNPQLCGPRGEEEDKNICYLTEKDLNNLSVETVWASVSGFMENPKQGFPRNN